MKLSVSNLSCFQVRVINLIDNDFATQDSMLKWPWEWVHDLRNEGHWKIFLVHSAVCKSDAWGLNTAVFRLCSCSILACSPSQRWGKLLSMCLFRLSTTTTWGKQAIAEPTNQMACGIHTHGNDISHHPNRLLKEYVLSHPNQLPWAWCLPSL